MHVCENKPALSLFFDIVQLFTTAHLENVCQKNNESHMVRNRLCLHLLLT